jgi:hypothetical protein
MEVGKLIELDDDDDDGDGDGDGGGGGGGGDDDDDDDDDDDGATIKGLFFVLTNFHVTKNKECRQA